jgi:hypothetical protein
LLGKHVLSTAEDIKPQIICGRIVMTGGGYPVVMT